MTSFLRINGDLHVPVRVEGSDLYDGEYFVRMDKQIYTNYFIAFLPIEFKGFPPSFGKLFLEPEFRCPDEQEPRVLSCIKNKCCVR